MDRNGEKRVLRREECDRRYQWHIEDLYPTNEDWEADYRRLETELSALSAYGGRLAEGADTFLEYMEKKTEAMKRFERVYVYANQRYHEDTGNEVYQGLSARAQTLALKLQTATIFEEPELLSIGRETIEAWMGEREGMALYQRFFEELFRQEAHVLSQEMEGVLADVSDIAGGISNIYSMFNNADVRFPSIRNETGEETAVSHGRYVALMESEDREVRKAAFASMYTPYEQYKNTLAATYAAAVKGDVFAAKMRRYDSALSMALSGSEIPEEVYTRLIDTVRGHMDLMYRYVALRKRALKVDELHMYDIYAPIVKKDEREIPFDRAKEIVREALAPLGEEYVGTLSAGMDGGWIDVYENVGKRSGAYSWGAYGTHPYVLMNYQGNLNDVFTLAHEMGHSMHSWYSDQSQPYPYAGYRIFVAEVASTVNEALLMEALLKKTDDAAERARLINHFLEQFKGTLYRQTMFAEFEKKAHEMAAEGQPLTADALNKVYYGLNQDYFGDGIVLDGQIALEWARIPHFYTPFYVYQYATGYSAAIAISRRILRGEPGAREGYLKFLCGGNSMGPIDLLKLAGVDMTTPEPVESALHLFGELLDEMESLLD